MQLGWVLCQTIVQLPDGSGFSSGTWPWKRPHGQGGRGKGAAGPDLEVAGMFAEAFSGSFKGLTLRIWRVRGDLYFRQRPGRTGSSDGMKESQLLVSEVHTHFRGASARAF